MATYKPTNSLSATDAAYIAGIIDGEGTVSLSKRHRNENRQLEISIANTESALLETIVGVIGAGRITQKRTRQAHHTPSAVYQISNRQALTLLTQISPYLRTYKRRRAELVLQHYVRLTPRNGKYTAEISNERRMFITQFLNTKP